MVNIGHVQFYKNQFTCILNKYEDYSPKQVFLTQNVTKISFTVRLRKNNPKYSKIEIYYNFLQENRKCDEKNAYFRGLASHLMVDHQI